MESPAHCGHYFRYFWQNRMQFQAVIFQDKKGISESAAYRFVALSHQTKGRFCVALAGGSTPILLYSLLAQPLFRDSIEWERVHLFFGDERAVPPDSPDSNYRMAHESLLAHIPLPPENIHRLRGESEDLDAEAFRYEAEIRALFPDTAVPAFDLVLLGMGADGHCASLFPHKASLGEQNRLVVPAEPGLKPFVPRLTFTYPLLNHAKQTLFLVSGADKAETLQQVLQGEPRYLDLPSQGVQPVAGNVTWLVDREAAARLGKE